ncbi:NepR family anti-sigma factor [Sphingobium sp. CR28]|uniref:NepR family anti-sigma factor n=1 Tax=Sphingobium sp. CR28 TaxID=3400272 RepID=UPI003FEF3B00
MTEKIKAGKDSRVKARSPRGDKTKDMNVGQVLRSAYQQTVSEGVPDELMDLLNRLD